MPTAALDLLDVDPFDLVEDEEPFAPVQKVDAAASVAELLDRALAIIAQYEKPTRRGRRPRRKARVTAHLPGEHRQQDHAGGLSSPNALKGLSVLGAAEYARLYGDEQDGAGIELGVEGEDFGLSARYFDTGDMHVVLELEDGRRQVLEEMNPESMRQLAYDIEELLAVDETEYVSDDPYDVIEERRSEVHDFFLSKDGVGDISLTPGEADGDYLELSPEQAQDFVNVLLDLADSYEEHFAGADDDVEVVAGSARPPQRKPVAAHGNHDQSTHGRKKSLKLDAPKPAPKRAGPEAKPAADVAAPKAPARKRAAPKAKAVPAPVTAHLKGKHPQESHGGDGVSNALDKLKLGEGEEDPKALAAAAADEEDGDWEEALDALIVALDELSSGHVMAAWDPAKHPRNPAGKGGGGRFRSMVDQLKDAITEHRDGKGTGDPLARFDREQLRRAAKTRGITLQRGEDRESIAQKLIGDLGGREPAKTPAKKATPRKRKPVPLTPEQEMERWKADASKPGRVAVSDSGPTKREAYIASWERGIERARKDIAEVEANGPKYRLEDLRKSLAYNIDGRDRIRDSTDPSLDEPYSDPTFTLAQKVDPDRPLAVYGDILHMEGSSDEWNHLNLTELERIPAPLHGIVAAHMAEKGKGGIWVGDTAVPEMNHSHDLEGEKPRGWGDDKTFDDVNGAYRRDSRVMLVGRTENSARRGDKTASHEFGHALDAALGTPSADPDWQAIHTKAVAKDFVSPYFKQSGKAGPEEFWAEAFSTWVTARRQNPGYDTKAKYIIQLGVADTADEIHEYFNRLAAKAGVQ